MNKLLNLSIVATALFVAACSADDPRQRPPVSTTPPPETFNIQVVHAVSDAPTVDVSINGAVAASGVDYKGETGQFVNESTGTYSVTVAANLPGDASETVVDIPDLPYETTTFNTIFVVGTVAGADITSVTVARAREAIAEDTVRVSVLHAAAGAPAVDIYVVGADVEEADLGMETPINTDPVNFGDPALGPLDLAAEDSTGTPIDYRIYVTAAGTTNVVFDSGSVSLPGGVDAVVAAVDNTTVGVDTAAIPISALLVTATSATDIVDESTVAEVRIVHTISDLANPVDVRISTDITTESDDMQILEEVATIGPIDFPEVSPSQVPGGVGADLAGDDYVIQVLTAGTETILINAGDADNDPAATTINSGIFYDAIAQGLANGMEMQPTPDVLYLVNDLRRVATAAKLRLIHSSASTGDVDIYIVASTVTDITDIAPTLAEVAYGDSAVQELAEGDYKVIITAAGDKTAVIDTGAVGLVASGVYTAIARDAAVGEAGPNLILLDDFTPPAT